MIHPTYDWSRLFFGEIEKVFEPNDPQNPTKYQFCYQVLLTVDNYAQVPCKAVRMDPDGSFLNYGDRKLAPGYRVFVLFPRGDRSLGVIIGGSRLFNQPQSTADGFYLRDRFNEVQFGVDQTGNWAVASDGGPNAQVNKTRVTIDDSVGDSVTVDKAAKLVTIKGNALSVVIQGDANVQVNGNLNAKVGKDCNIQAGGTATIKADKIIFNKEGSGITTANSHQGVVDLITCVPVEESEDTFGDV